MSALDTQAEITISPLDDLAEVQLLLRRRWGETLIMHGRTWMLGEYSALAARGEGAEILGLATYFIQKNTVLVLTIDNYSEIKGIGTRLLEALAERGRAAGANTIRVMTTNDNTPALRYFQLIGFNLVAFYPGAINTYRIFAPTLPEKGVDGINVRDAIELERPL